MSSNSVSSGFGGCLGVGLAVVLFAGLALALLVMLLVFGLGPTLLYGLPVAALVVLLALGVVLMSRPNRGLSAEETRRPE
ncbi:MAG TPA: hypothetical protein VFH17_03810 [Coriobacteriia bacterium]|nr:hypothetical protein [Coriobacteriia bacterium]